MSGGMLLFSEGERHRQKLKRAFLTELWSPRDIQGIKQKTY